MMRNLLHDSHIFVKYSHYAHHQYDVSVIERERDYEDETFYSSYSNVCRFGYVSECGVETKALNEPYASSLQTYSLCRRMVLALALEIYIKMCVRVHICGNTL